MYWNLVLVNGFTLADDTSDARKNEENGFVRTTTEYGTWVRAHYHRVRNMGACALPRTGVNTRRHIRTHHNKTTERRAPHMCTDTQTHVQKRAIKACW
jgi:hypothetical protein